MIDSSKWSVIEAGLKCVQGKPVVNSITPQGGRGGLPRQGTHGRRYGAGVVVMAFDEHGPGGDGRAQGRDLRARLPAAHRRGRLRARGHRLRPEHPRGRDRDRGARPVRAVVHRGDAPDQGALPGREDERRRLQSLVLVPRQRRRAGGDARRLPLPRDPRRAWTWASSTRAS